MKVLFLEDDPGVALWARNAFVFLGGIEDVEVVSDNFRQLFDEDRWEGVDVFVTDWMVPGFVTRDLLEWVRERFPRIRTIVYTALDTEFVDHGGFADKVIKKAGQVEELIGAIRA